ncbi:MAG TPA: HD domain-containing protein [Candidatus Acidoferrales bacterium]|nr:HD domain-containing protein [Candidatus Acidoferrales bacterium]
MMSQDQAAAIDARLLSVLPEGTLYAVGGRVRDELRARIEGIPLALKDLDYVVVGVALDELVARLRTIARAQPAGASFPVVKVTFDGVTVDVALPRRERSTGLGHRDFAIDAGPDVRLEDDLARRDFRINMMARAIGSGRLVDPYEGEADVIARRIRLLRPEAFIEDPLRMLRAVQFATRFGYEIEPQTFAAIQAAADLLPTVSSERIHDELVKLLHAPRPSVGIELLRASGLLAQIWPEILEGVGVEQNVWHAYDVYHHNLATLDAAPPDDLVVRLAALLHDVGKPRTKDGPHFYRHELVGAEMARKMLERLRFDTETVERVSGLVREHMYTANPEMTGPALRRFVRRVGPANLAAQFALRHADVAGSGLPKRDESNERFEARVATLLAERPAMAVTDLAVSGEDVRDALIRSGRLPAGSRGGREVGEVLRALLERVTDQPEANERTTLLSLLDDEISRMEETRPSR